jgi:hypothetical protein
MSILWVIGIIALSLGMVAGPAMALRTSKGAERQMQLRDAARKLGMQVAMESLPLREGDKDRTPIAVYRLMLDKHMPRLANHCARRARLDHKEWMFLRNRPELELYEALLALYQQLPADVEAIECQPNYVAAWWREKGNAATLATLHEQLQAIAELHYSLR